MTTQTAPATRATKMSAAERKAYDDGAMAKRAGLHQHRGTEFQKSGPLRDAWNCGWTLQSNHPGQQITHLFVSFPSTDVKTTEGDYIVTTTNTTRTAAELDTLKAAYRASTYDAYAAEQRAGGFEPQDFDEAFAAHLATLPAPTTAAAPAKATAKTAEEKLAEKEAAEKAKAAKKATADAEKADKKAKADAEKADKKATADKAKADVKAAADAEKAAKPKAEPKAAAEPKAKKFRPTSADRAAITTLARSIAGDVPARCLLPNGGTYDEFLKGTLMTVEGNLTMTLDVFTAKDTKTKVGAIQIVVSGGDKMTASKV